MPYLRRLIKRWVPSDRGIEIFDVGCGYGALLYALLDAGYRNLSGVDGSREQVVAAQRLGLSQVRQGDLLTALASTSSNSLDLVVAFDVLEHLFKDEVMQFMDHFHRILRPGGRVLIHVPNGEGILGGRMRYADITHELTFTHQSLLQFGALSGFSQFHFEEDVPVVHGVMSALRWALWRLVRLPFRIIYIVETGDLGRNPLLTQNMLAVFVR
jgi:SAM-dependent methyltransferase